MNQLTKLYVVVNGELGMSQGKMAAQAVHAAMRSKANVPNTVIVLAGSTEQIHNLSQYLFEHDLPYHKYIDEGVNEVPPMSATALAFGNVVEDFVPDFIKGFNLYRVEEKEGWGGFLFFLGIGIGAIATWLLPNLP